MTPADTEMVEKLSISIHINVTADPANAAAVIVLDGLFILNTPVYLVLVVGPVVDPVGLRQGHRKICRCPRY